MRARFLLLRKLYVLTASIAIGPILGGMISTTGYGQDAQAVIVCPSDFAGEIGAWVAYREKQGIKCRTIEPQKTAEATRAAIADVASSTTRYLLIVGDTPQLGGAPRLASQVPTHYLPSTVTGKWFSTPTFASDSVYSDWDQDGTPDLSVGRLPVDHPIQLKRAIEKIIAYEQSVDFGPWRNEVQLVAGVGGFGTLVDTTIETVTRGILTSTLPVETSTRIRFASPGHAFYPRSGRFTQTVLDDYSRGARFWVYAGHGQVTHLDEVLQKNPAVSDAPWNRQSVLGPRDVKRLDAPDGRWPIALVLACFTGAMDAQEDSIAEQMWLADDGPIAVIAGSRVTMPYGNATAAVGLVERIYQDRIDRLGDAWLETIASMQSNPKDKRSPTRTMIDAMAGLISPAGSDLLAERREHTQLYHLIGDPMLNLRHGKTVSIKVSRGYQVGTPIDVSVTSPIAGKLTLRIDRLLGASVVGDPNDLTVVQIQASVGANRTFDHRFDLPASLVGPVVIRAHVAGQTDWASSAARTIIRSLDEND